MTSKESETLHLVAICAAAFVSSAAIGCAIGFLLKIACGQDLHQAIGEARQCWTSLWNSSSYQAIPDNTKSAENYV